MPIFALANAGVIINSHSFEGSIPPIALGVFFGLVFGKPLGIFALSWVACKLKIAVLPEGVKWGQIASVGIIAGIGFTMSIFIDNLAFSDPKIVDTGKAAILISSFVSAVLGL
ncbi:Na(+)/H(+) antiporter NhaA [bioreactor metagenome]|uniref:Na(+)/H(+) antiporter NhaA n=1 Tax=bioreactor metagenome TaxID=1076179 RepID=A0A645DMC9_9ZZZZ